MELYASPEVYERVVHYDEEKKLQIRLTVSCFRGIEYLHLRKYYLTMKKSGALLLMV